jgi:hypothetical protein
MDIAMLKVAGDGDGVGVAVGEEKKGVRSF